MLIAACALVVAATVVACVLVVRERARASEWAIGVVTAAHERERAHWERSERKWLDERQLLLNRIKPETAQAVIGEEIIAPAAIGMDDDAGFWETKEALAERMMAQEREAVGGAA